MGDFLPSFCTRLSAFEGSDSNVVLSEMAKDFLANLGLPRVHPACSDPDLLRQYQDTVVNYTSLYPVLDVSQPLKSLVTLWKQTAPPLLAMSELWLRLFAYYLAPLCLAVLIHMEVKAFLPPSFSKEKNAISNNKISPKSNELKDIFLNVVCMVGLICSSALLTDPLYVHECGRHYGAAVFATTCFLVLKRLFFGGGSQASQPTESGGTNARNMPALLLIVSLAVAYQVIYHMVLHPEDSTADIPAYKAGLHYSQQNKFVSKIVQHWPLATRLYEDRNELNENNGHALHNETLEYPTPWTITGDSRTGIPFLMNPSVPLPLYHRVWVPTHEDDEEGVHVEANALDIAFPSINNRAEHFPHKPIFVVLHGLNGGSDEEYVKQLVHQQIAKGSTVAVMIARGLMGTPIIGMNVFHGARVSDIARTAKLLKGALAKTCAAVEPSKPHPPLIGVGYSMGAIIMANYVARSGPDCALDGAVSVSGGLDMREQFHFHRSMRLWQPMLAQDLRKTVMRGTRQKYETRLTEEHFLELMRSVHITEIDEFAVVRYNGFRDVMHYYTEMSALGDFDGYDGRIANVAVPMLVLHALDDPLITWRTVGNPQKVVQSGNGYVLQLLTSAGGHVGWPLGFNPRNHGWDWMNGAIDGFSTGLVAARSE